MTPQRLLDQDVGCADIAHQRRFLAEEAHAERVRTLRGFAWGLGISGIAWVALGLVWRWVVGR